MYHRFRFSSSLLIIHVLFLLPFFSCDRPERPPNIIFFIADDMYPEMFNALPQGAGKNLTPNLDRLAEEGVLMLNQYVTSPVCTPSRFSCLTGRYASRATNDSFLRFTETNEGQTVIQWNTQLTGQEKTLPHYLREAGYSTGMVGKNHVIETPGLYRFPDYNADPLDPEVNYPPTEDWWASGFPEMRPDLSRGLTFSPPVFSTVPAELILFPSLRMLTAALTSRSN